MADWQRKIYLNPEWEQAKTGDITLQSLAASIARKLGKVKDFSRDRMTDPNPLDDERDEIVERFKDLAAEIDPSREDLDDVMIDLYDWGDTRLDDQWPGKKACWIDTISRRPPLTPTERADG
jgi:hypothetical protein